VIDTSTNQVSKINVGNGPFAIAFNPNPALPYAYVSNSSDSTVSIIELATQTVVSTFATGAGGDDTLDIAVSDDGLNVYLANYDGGPKSYGTVAYYTVDAPVADGWVQLQASNGWGDNVAVNNLLPLPNNNGLVVGLSNGQVATWNNPVLSDGTILSGPGAGIGCSNGAPGSCWDVVPGSNLTTVNGLVASGQTGGFVAFGMNGNLGWVQGFNGAPAFGGPGVQSATTYPGSNPNDPLEIPTTLLPYDGTTLVGSIGSAPVIAESGTISTPSYASNLPPGLSASSAGCGTSYNSGGGAGCAG
jgi:DNA-binding beta-propeller fold protein YncE